MSKQKPKPRFRLEASSSKPEVIKRPALQSPKAAELPEWQLTIDAGILVYSVRVRATDKKAARRVVKTLMRWMNTSTPLGFVIGNPPDRALIDHFLMFRPDEIGEMKIKRIDTGNTGEVT